MWAAEAFLDLSGDREWLATFGGAAPRSISEAAIRAYYFETLGMRSERLFASLRRWVKAMDLVWQKDWSEKAQARAREEADRSRDRSRKPAPV